MIESGANYEHESIPQISTYRTRRKIISATLQSWLRRFAPSWQLSTIRVQHQVIILKPIVELIFSTIQPFIN
ncbi:hypothetical protein CF647_34310 [Burkholderia sp. 117]|nr:hypothetical protein BUC_4501 [Burkholderia pseudomallei 576]PNW93866.1 hypothetical protein CF649_34530 [Burkholderia sp. 136(2017)]PNX24155.1 hypothetical protein CF647_34310 [Burkholderia sp. 117]PNX29721.1 hypothetical protein CF648_35825 [Burkholderia sp. 137]